MILSTLIDYTANYRVVCQDDFYVEMIFTGSTLFSSVHPLRVFEIAL